MGTKTISSHPGAAAQKRNALPSKVIIRNFKEKMNTELVRKGVLCALGFITLGAMSASAFAQSAEYRRGYDQGYRDGIEAQSRQGQQGRWVGRIIIEHASYGIRDASCNVRDTVQQAAGWRRNISIAATNELCGDPAPNHLKQLDVRYRCGDGPALHVQTREGGSVTLNCQ